MLIPNIAESDYKAVGAAETDFDTDMLGGKIYRFAATTNCLIKQGKALLVTCATKANTVDGETLTVVLDNQPTVFEFDVAGNGVRDGNTAMDVSAATTAASVAAIVAAAIDAAYSDITVTDNSDGTITLLTAGHRMTASDTVAHASFTIANSTALASSGADASMAVGAGFEVYVDGLKGQTLSVIRASADGLATLTPCRYS